MKEIVTPKGILKYRMPNILEAYDIIDASGIYTEGCSLLKLKRNIIQAMEPVIDYSSIEGVSSYPELLMDLDNIMPLTEVSGEILDKVLEILKKKN